MPHKDLKVTASNERIKPGFARRAWAAFSSGRSDAMVNRVISALRESGSRDRPRQPHAKRWAAPFLYAFLGEWRRGKAGSRAEGGSRQANL